LDDLSQLLSLCWEGPELAEVDDVLTQESLVDMDIKEFAIL